MASHDLSFESHQRVQVPIPEECDEETESDHPNEPITPVSGRQSQDFNALQQHDIASSYTNPDSFTNAAGLSNLRHAVTNATPKSQLTLDTTPTVNLPYPPRTPVNSDDSRPPSTPTTTDAETGSILQKRSTRGSTSSFKRTMSSLFRRTNSNSLTDKSSLNSSTEAPMQDKSRASDTNLADGTQRNPPPRRWSMNRSSATTRSNSPPSPASPPLEMASAKAREQASMPTVPKEDEFLKKKSRASTGLNLRSRAINFVVHSNNGSTNGSRTSTNSRPVRRRASSFDMTKRSHRRGSPDAPADPSNPIHADRSIWAMPAEAGTGAKARRMSLSLPDDLQVDVAELLNEFEYHHKFLGRHGKHLGKGATSKVTLMVRKGCPGELYAVKEFRGKSTRETHEEYEKKVKSEYTLAKSLHHPNIVETISLCTDHGRWNHVMEYCAEGDLFSLISKKYLTKEDREADRLCLFKQLVQGINYLHNNGIAHRDIKLENLLVTSDSKLKITDFGVSEVFSGIHPGLREAGGQCGVAMGEIRMCAPGICGSEPYIAPEVLAKAGPYDPRALDVWSSAIVMIHLIFGGAIWGRAEETSNNTNYNALVKGWEKWKAKNSGPDREITDLDYPYVMAFDNFVKPPALRRVLLQMLNPDPARRISIAEVANNRWVKNVECCQPESYDDPSLTIDASKKICLVRGQRKIFCHNHLPPREHNTHSLGKMPGSVGY
ncbi:kinase-like domain-containing protein [Coniochaeta sp. 2T2.1]|nr:kinase-like domain-containing protein [Coniochaeta sp. 2T2.1]